MHWSEVFRAEPEQPRALTEDELRQAFRLGVLGAILSREVCHGRRNGCTCSKCREIGAMIDENGFTPDGLIAGPKSVRQPWEPVIRGQLERQQREAA